MTDTGSYAGAPPHSPYALPEDYAECRRLHRAHGTTYYFASQLFGPKVKRRTHALYGFVRLADELVDNPIGEPSEQLRALRNELLHGLEGVPPKSGVLRAFCDVVVEAQIPIEEPLLFLDAMEQDLSVTRYQSFQDLRGYMRGSAAAVGVMMCAILEADRSEELFRSAMALGEAMQLTNFLRDVGEDRDRGRIYLPLEDLASFEVAESEIASGRVTERFVRLMRFEIDRARALYRQAMRGIPLLPPNGRRAVTLAAILYARILDKIELNNYRVFDCRARTSKLEKLIVTASVFASDINAVPEYLPRTSK